jgi:hypothetical protein
MNSLNGFSELYLAVPAVVLLGSFIVRKLFNVSFAMAAASIGAPLVLPLRELPFLRQFSDLPHEYLIGGAWGAIACVALFWAFLKPAVSSAVASLGFLKLGYLVLLGTALVVASLLVLNPETLTRNFPGWKGSAGLVLLAASCIGASKALWGMIRATVLVGLWGAVSLVLASSIFLDKLPQNISRSDLAKLHGAISSELVLETIEQLHGISWSGAGALKFLRIKLEHAAGSEGSKNEEGEGVREA